MDILEKACSEKKMFLFPSGEKAQTLKELITILEEKTPVDIANHITSSKNDFSLWIEEALHLPHIAKQIPHTHNPHKIIKAITNAAEKHHAERKETHQALLPLLLILMLVGILMLLAKQQTLSKEIATYQTELEQLENKYSQLSEYPEQEYLPPLPTNVTIIYPQENTSERVIPLPAPHISPEQLRLYEDRIEITITNASWTTFTNSGSMRPLLDEGAYGLQVVPRNESSINRGDIIAYEENNELIVHRVISIDEDDQGWYVRTQGDTNTLPDPEKIRFSAIKYVLVGVIY